MKTPGPMISRLTVMSYELDAFGHVNNANYLQYLEKARNDFMIAKGMEFNDFFKWNRFPVVRRAHLDFTMPARAGDRLIITGQVSDHTLTSFTLCYRATRDPDQKLIFTAETFHVFVNDRNRPVRIPEVFYRQFINLE